MFTPRQSNSSIKPLAELGTQTRVMLCGCCPTSSVPKVYKCSVLFKGIKTSFSQGEVCLCFKTLSPNKNFFFKKYFLVIWKHIFHSMARLFNPRLVGNRKIGVYDYSPGIIRHNREQTYLFVRLLRKSQIFSDRISS